MAALGALGRLTRSISDIYGGVFGRFLSAKFTVAAAVIATFLTMLAALTLLFRETMQALYLTTPAWFHWGLGVIPDNVPQCVSAVITMRLALWVYYVKFTMVRIKAGTV